MDKQTTMKKTLLTCTLLIGLNSMIAQTNDQKLPYHEIPQAQEDYTSGNILSRMIDGLGYRYYWATEGLTEKDLDYRPSEEARNINETLEHILSLSGTIKNAPTNTANIRPTDFSGLTFQEKRKMTLNNLQEASKLLIGKTANEIKGMKMIFERGEKSVDFPFWNMINGPIADAIYHTGQVVSFRRSVGNSMNPGVNVLMGKTREQ